MTLGDAHVRRSDLTPKLLGMCLVLLRRWSNSFFLCFGSGTRAPGKAANHDRRRRKRGTGTGSILPENISGASESIHRHDSPRTMMNTMVAVQASAPGDESFLVTLCHQATELALGIDSSGQGSAELMRQGGRPRRPGFVRVCVVSCVRRGWGYGSRHQQVFTGVRRAGA